MPLKEYLKALKQSNIVIDQVNSYSLGMNGLFALAMGKVVLGGSEKESLKSQGIKNSPVINVLPSKESIIEAIDLLVKDKNKILSIRKR